MKRLERDTRLVVLASACAPGGPHPHRNVIFKADTAPGPFAGS